jgi:hypothetical protein
MIIEIPFTLALAFVVFAICMVMLERELPR